MPADTLRVGDRDVPLAEMEAEIAAATPGPWERCCPDCQTVHETDCNAKVTSCYYGKGLVAVSVGGDMLISEEEAGNNATLIAHAPTYLTALVAAVRALRAQVVADHPWIGDRPAGGCGRCGTVGDCAARRAVLTPLP